MIICSLNKFKHLDSFTFCFSYDIHSHTISYGSYHMIYERFRIWSFWTQLRETQLCSVFFIFGRMKNCGLGHQWLSRSNCRQYINPHRIHRLDIWSSLQPPIDFATILDHNINCLLLFFVWNQSEPVLNHDSRIKELSY